MFCPTLLNAVGFKNLANSEYLVSFPISWQGPFLARKNCFILLCPRNMLFKVQPAPAGLSKSGSSSAFPFSTKGFIQEADSLCI